MRLRVLPAVARLRLHPGLRKQALDFSYNEKQVSSQEYFQFKISITRLNFDFVILFLFSLLKIISIALIVLHAQSHGFKIFKKYLYYH